MNGFVASNGLSILDGKQFTVAGVPLTGREVVALREFFRAEEDERLGRWRWAENPDYVVYPKGDGWIVSSEVSANSKHYSHREHASIGSSGLSQAMRAYFAAHPEPKKPWEDAKEGDVWVLEINGEEEATLFRHDRTFVSRDGDEFAPDESYITAGRRIFPEGDAA